MTTPRGRLAVVGAVLCAGLLILCASLCLRGAGARIPEATHSFEEGASRPRSSVPERSRPPISVRQEARTPHGSDGIPPDIADELVLSDWLERSPADPSPAASVGVTLHECRKLAVRAALAYRRDPRRLLAQAESLDLAKLRVGEFAVLAYAVAYLKDRCPDSDRWLATRLNIEDRSAEGFWRRATVLLQALTLSPLPPTASEDFYPDPLRVQPLAPGEPFDTAVGVLKLALSQVDAGTLADDYTWNSPTMFVGFTAPSLAATAETDADLGRFFEDVLRTTHHRYIARVFLESIARWQGDSRATPILEEIAAKGVTADRSDQSRLASESSQSCAISALGRRGTEADVDALLRRFNAPEASSQHRCGVLRALASTAQAERVTSFLVGVIRDSASGDERRWGLHALTRGRRDRLALEAARTAMDRAGDDPELYSHVAEVCELARQFPEEAAPLLRSVAGPGKPDDVRSIAIRTLVQLDGTTAQTAFDSLSLECKGDRIFEEQRALGLKFRERREARERASARGMGKRPAGQ